MKNFLTIFFPSEKVHLHKDVGMIPYSLSKYRGWKCGLAYLDSKGLIKDSYYEVYVELLPIKYSENKLAQWLYIIFFIFKQAKKYDAVNLYHLSKKNIVISFLLKLANSRMKIYCKLDLNLESFKGLTQDRLVKVKERVKLTAFKYLIDVFSVETKSFYDELMARKIFGIKLIYIPNGVEISSQYQNDFSKKENIILTVGRLGTEPKNTELLIDAIANISKEKLIGWKVYLVGSTEPNFLEYINEVCKEKTYLNDVFVMTGNIASKAKLYEIYAKAKIFCLPSRWESFGLAVLEAMYFKNYVIVTDYPAAFDLTDNNRVGTIIKSEDGGRLKNVIEDCVDGKINLHPYGELAHQYTMNNFQWEGITKKIAAYLEGLSKK